MNIVDLQRKLIAAARRNPPADRVPYAFEKRVMALLGSRSVPDDAALWARALWRGAAACFAVTVLIGAFSILSSTGGPAVSSNDLSQDFESTMLAAVDQDSEVSE